MTSVKRLLLMILVLVFTVGCSPTITKWSDRGLVGLDNEVANVEAWHSLAAGMIERQRNQGVVAAYSDVELVRAGAVKRADGTVVKLDAKYWKTSQMILLAHLKMIDGKVSKLDAMRKRNLQNIEHVRQAFVGVKRLNKVWAGGADVLAVQLAELAAIVRELKTERARAP